MAGVKAQIPFFNDLKGHYFNNMLAVRLNKRTFAPQKTTLSLVEKQPTRSNYNEYSQHRHYRSR